MAPHQPVASLGFGLGSALLFLGGIGAGIPALTVLSPLPILVGGLRQGPSSAWLSGLVAVVIGGLFGGPVVLAFLAAAVALPASLMIRLSHTPDRRTGQPLGSGMLVVWMAITAALMVLTAFVLGGTHPEGLIGALRDGMAPALEASIAILAGQGDPAAVRATVEAAIPVIPGAMASAWVMIMTLNMALARSIAGRLTFGSPAPVPGGASYRVPELWDVAVAAMLGLWLLPGGLGVVGENLAMILAMPFLILGLAVIADVLKTRLGLGAVGQTAAMTVVVIALLIPLVAPLVVGLGLAEHWFRLRKPPAAPPPPVPPRHLN